MQDSTVAKLDCCLQTKRLSVYDNIQVYMKTFHGLISYYMSN